ncbi:MULTISPECIES: maleylacetoacetate isomerase [unclassified Rhizobium]|uniref:maleylacetoacetate isomerase n=1 Tax=unclassified Rhizobium TaxID=2613769 RepID=UPI0006FE6E2F|nr:MULTISPECIES: maleylacetoacetate isomerase [unclassified Rhizobium]KQV35183.1 maleylacetoacetate isomerase [Rhizobium sp. Root1212]KRD24988.1 maleylacetoacetate isomerase [Rhizobium sp. Root268]
MIRLYDYWRSSASYRVRIALGIAGLPWESLPVDLLKGEHHSPEYHAINPQGLLPVVEMDGQRFSQSLAIIEFLEEAHGLGLLPDDLRDRARVRALAYAIAMDIHPICNPRVVNFAIAHSNGGMTMEVWMRNFIGAGFSALEDMLAGGDHCFGNRVTLADICLAPQLYNAVRWGVDLAAMPKIRRIGAHLETLPAFAAAHPDRQAH